MKERRKKADIRALIFDIDGTLVDSFEVYRGVFNQGIADYNVEEVPRDVLRDLLAKNLSLREILQKVFPSPIDDATYETCREKILRLYREAELEGVKSFPGTEALFRYLQGMGIKIGIATGRMSTVEDEWTRFARLGLHMFISTIVTSREVEHRKPAPDVIIECARRLDVPTKQCVVVGDTKSDIIAARMAGAIAVAVTTGHEDEEVLQKAEPDIVLQSIKDIVRYLEPSLASL
jgi:HAD superfamily hydrolase (TIGR01549 family)